MYERRKFLIFETAKKLIKAFEGLYLKAYQDPVGIWTIGYGHVIKADERGRLMGGEISREEAERLLEKDMERIWAGMVKLLGEELLGRMHYLMVGALLSFCFNVGPGGVRKDTGIGKALREGEYEKAADELLKWVYAGGKVLRGLVRRRAAERAVFLEGVKRLRETGNVEA